MCKCFQSLPQGIFYFHLGWGTLRHLRKLLPSINVVIVPIVFQFWEGNVKPVPHMLAYINVLNWKPRGRLPPRGTTWEATWKPFGGQIPPTEILPKDCKILQFIINKIKNAPTHPLSKKCYKNEPNKSKPCLMVRNFSISLFQSNLINNTCKFKWLVNL